MNRIIKMMTVMAFVAMPAFQAAASDDEPKLTVKPTGRVLMDGAVYLPDGDGLADGAALPDIRMGVKASYGKWSGKIDAGYSFNKLSMKDVYIQYSFDPANYLRAGYFVHQFGLNAATSSSMKPQMEAATTDTYFNATGRNIGVEYVHDRGQAFLSFSGIVAGTSMTSPSNDQEKVSVGALNRAVWRPFHETGRVAQVGISLWYQSALHKKDVNDDGETVASPGYFNWSAGFPTRVSKEGMLGADVTYAKGVFKLSPEWLLMKGRIACEGQYYFMNVARRSGYESYRAQGVYGLLRGILIGSDYGYSHGDAGLATPGKGTLEMVLGYNYTDGNQGRSGIHGGISNDASMTLNYYFNQYVIGRLRYSYTDVRSSDVQRHRHVNAIQARLQIIF